MIKRSPIKKSEAYNTAFGEIKWTLDGRNIYRLESLAKHIIGKSIFDAGCGESNFLNLIKDRYQIGGIEVNAEITCYSTQVIGQDEVNEGR